MLRCYNDYTKDMTHKADIDVDRLANEIRHIDGSHTMGAGELAEHLVRGEIFTDLLDEVERMRESETNYLKHGYYLTAALREISELANNHPEQAMAAEISSILETMWENITKNSPGRAQSLWGALTRSEQEEYRDIHYEVVPNGEARAHELEDLARKRLDEQG